MAEMTQLEERQIRDYVDPRRHQNPRTKSPSYVGRRRVAHENYDLYDVWMSSGKRWWVITNVTNLYPQDDFKGLNQAFTYHLGLNAVLREQFAVQPDEGQVETVGKPWRRYAGAVEALATAEEAEDFQAVGIRCRESLLALVRDNIDASWVRVQGEKPQVDNAKAWFAIFANSLSANSKPRAYFKSLGERTWDLTVWLQHYVDASEIDAEIVLGATREVLRTFALLQVDYSQPMEQRCPKCDSYQVVKESSEVIEREGAFGTFLHDECASCGWRSEQSFDEWPRERLQRLIDYKTGAWTPPRKSMGELEVRATDEAPS